jgi:hypothetical protein
LTSYDGLQLATEKINLYPLFFEDWVHNLMQRAQENAAPPEKNVEPEQKPEPEQKAEPEAQA